jgi:hypothetical protein
MPDAKPEADGSILKKDPKNDRAKRHPQMFNLQFSITISGLSGSPLYPAQGLN